MNVYQKTLHIFYASFIPPYGYYFFLTLTTVAALNVTFISSPVGSDAS